MRDCVEAEPQQVLQPPLAAIQYDSSWPSASVPEDIGFQHVGGPSDTGVGAGREAAQELAQELAMPEAVDPSSSQQPCYFCSIPL